MLLYGPWGVAFGLFGWFANPLLGLAFLLRRRARWLSLLLGAWALYLGLASFGLERLPDNRSYDFHDVTSLGVGYYLWVMAIAVFCAGQAWSCQQARRGVAVPRWHLVDGLLALLLALAVVVASQNDALRFQLERVLDAPPSWKTGQPKGAI
jgi:hypothetical protein